MVRTNESDDYDQLDVAIRAWARRKKSDVGAAGNPRKSRRRKGSAVQRTVVFDTETTTDASQRLNFGVWRYYLDRLDGLPGTTCFQEGILYADELPERDPAGFRLLLDYVENHEASTSAGRDKTIHLLSRSEFAEKVIFKRGYAQDATIAAFNLPFDLSRIAIDATTSRRSWSDKKKKWNGYFGGNSLVLFTREFGRPRIAYKAIDSKRALIRFTSTANGRAKGYTHNWGTFLDLRTLTFALTGESHNLESACRRFKTPYSKRDVTHGSITEEYVTYCREDVGATTKLLTATTQEFRRHPIDLKSSNALSPASIGKSYLKAMGIKPALDRHPEFDSAVLAASMAAYFGGRAECRIRKVPLPVTYLDFLSMYPTVHVLMGTWSLVTADEVDVEDATESVRELLATSNLASRCFDQTFWHDLVGLVQIVPNGDVVPVRARYDPVSSSFNIGVNPFRDDGEFWYSLPDVVASVIQSGQVPAVIRAVRFRAKGLQRRMRPVLLRDSIEIDPRSTDFFRRVVEVRKTITTTDTVGDIEDLDKFLKVLANATAYGIYAEMTRREEPEKVEVVVERDDGTHFLAASDTPEDPENYCFPPLAAVITGGAKLMLGLLEHEVVRRGGAFVFCDTDSMAIVADESGALHPCPGGGETLPDGREAIRALTSGIVDDIVKKFEALNPYSRELIPGSILKIEEENFECGRRIPLWCYAISAKRYVLFRESVEGEAPRLVKISEHGLGHLLNPMDPEDESDGWMWDVWGLLLKKNLGLPLEEPPWLERPALTRITASGPPILKWFKAMNKERPYAEQVKPGNFFLIAHPDPLYLSGLKPFAPYEEDATKWMTMPWYDRATGEEIRITTKPIDGMVRSGTTRVRTYRDVLADYETHPEMKSLGPDGRGVGRGTVGLLRRRPVELLNLRRVGKEGNKLEERMEGLTLEEEEYLNEYEDSVESVWAKLVIPVLRTMNRSQLARDAGVNRRTIQRYLNKGVTPRAEHAMKLTKLAVEHARVSLSSHGMDTKGNDAFILSRYSRTIEGNL